MATSKEETRVLAVGYHAVFEAACMAARAEGFNVPYADPAKGFIQVTSGMTMTSWGENVDIRVGVDPSGSTFVTIRSSLVFGVADWGRNKKNVDRLFTRIDGVLADPRAAGVVAAPAISGGAWHQDPSGRHELRWWDGTTWTPHVSDRGVASTDPL